MIPLLLSIVCSTAIFVIFKLFQRYNIDTFQAIVVNYFTAAILGFALYGHEWKAAALVDTGWMLYAAICSLLFISLFLIMGKSSQVNGVASTSVAVKMSMAVSLLFMVYGYSEDLTWLKIAGILLAFVGVFLVSAPSKKNPQVDQATWMLVVLFFGSGMLDFVLNYVQKFELASLSPSLFSAIGFGLAGIIGALILAVKVIRKKTQLAWRNSLAGLLLGIPNYFSIYLLMLSYTTTGWQDSTVLAITNVAVVLASALLGILAFKEKLSPRKIIGLLAAVLAITTLYIASIY
ncbi:MAG: hypothetical protein A3D92_20320 [Bacteroidetes bacterium RIFCSPHIGHO2_02_FULL_44_7]|nr:MAG: hypothetical protein A3D92_20320 [Bacteroidetes bacterium RIFCSPHIGHO2_02_FULL_44_7]